jgi:TRAP-type C4-dicarboxylate transport system permease small subunit
MKTLINLVNRAAHIAHLGAGFVLVSMMFITLADVITRAVFNFTDGSVDLTFVGGIELIKFGLLFAILLTLPHSVAKSQVIVDLFTEKMNQRLKIYLEAFYNLGFALLGAGMSVRFFEAIESAYLTRETTQDLQIPLQYIYVGVVIATALLAVRALIIAGELVFHCHTPAENHGNEEFVEASKKRNNVEQRNKGELV